MIPRKLIFEQFKQLFYNVLSLAQLGTQKHSLPTTQQCQPDAFMYSVAFVVIVILSKGQLISKCLFGIFNSPKNQRKIQLYYYGTSSRIVFVRFLGELKIPKRHFEIN